MEEKRIIINWNSKKIMQKAEREKARLENKGYYLKHTIPGYNVAVLVYSI